MCHLKDWPQAHLLLQEAHDQEVMSSNPNNRYFFPPLRPSVICDETNEARFVLKWVKSFALLGPWWWSNGQRALLLLQQSEFESR